MASLALSAGLAPPHIDALTTAQAVDTAVHNHERRTGVPVAHTIDLPADVSLHVKTCLYRFVQEGLNNTFRHAKGSAVSVMASSSHGTLTVEVADSGPGLATPTRTPQTSKAAGLPASGLGLAGLKDRIEALGGTLEIASVPGHGTRLTARLAHVSERGLLQ